MVHVSWTKDSRGGCSTSGEISPEQNRGAESPLSGDSLSLSSDFSYNEEVFLIYTKLAFPFKPGTERTALVLELSLGVSKTVVCKQMRSWLKLCVTQVLPKRLWQIRAQIKLPGNLSS